MLKVGLTGGIGSGKSTVAAIFEVLGVPVYYADQAAKRLMHENAELKNKIIDQFGTEAYRDGVLNRDYLAAKVFSDPQQLALLNSFVHPLTIADAAAWMNRQRSPYTIKEAALIFESGANTSLDYVIGVSSPETLRIKRVMERDKISAEQVMARLHKQMNEADKMKKCDFLLFNDEQQLLVPQVIQLHEKLLQLSSR
jgi:dephospho-CoA kinase